MMAFTWDRKKFLWVLAVIVLLAGLFLISSIFSHSKSSSAFALSQIELAQQNLDVGECDKIGMGFYRDNCYLAMAQYLVDPNICDGISGEDYKEYCLRYKFENGYSLNISRTVWANVILNFDKPYNSVNFDYLFDSLVDSNGEATIFLDDEIIFEVREESVEKNRSYNSGAIILKDSSIGEHLLSVRNTPQNEKKSVFLISNFEMVQLGDQTLDYFDSGLENCEDWECITSIARSNDDPQVCSEMRKFNITPADTWEGECRTAIALDTKNASICGTMNPSGRYLKYNTATCYYLLAVELSDESLCEYSNFSEGGVESCKMKVRS